jgi:hypothetical protein
MGIALEEAPAPEAGGTRINGEVPAVDEAISRELSDAVPVILDKRSLEVIQNSPDGSELVVPIPAEDSAIPHQVPLEGMEILRIGATYLPSARHCVRNLKKIKQLV